MNIIQSIILGIIQGITEFLPISSSAHLVLVPYWLNWNFPKEHIFVFDVLVQGGTTLAVIIYFWRDLVAIVKAVIRGLIIRKPFEDPNARLGWLVVLASIPAGLAGLLIKDLVESAFNSPMITAILLLGTSTLLIAAELLGKKMRNLQEIKTLDAILIGLFQAISIFPGISRSGATISGGLLRKLDRSSAARFSFLMSIPVMVAAMGLGFKDLLDIPDLTSFIPIMAVGIITSAIIGFLSIHWLLGYLKKHSLFGFALYCIGVWLITFIIFLFRG